MAMLTYSFYDEINGRLLGEALERNFIQAFLLLNLKNAVVLVSGTWIYIQGYEHNVVKVDKA